MTSSKQLAKSGAEGWILMDLRYALNLSGLEASTEVLKWRMRVMDRSCDGNQVYAHCGSHDAKSLSRCDEWPNNGIV